MPRFTCELGIEYYRYRAIIDERHLHAGPKNACFYGARHMGLDGWRPLEQVVRRFLDPLHH